MSLSRPTTRFRGDGATATCAGAQETMRGGQRQLGGVTLAASWATAARESKRRCARSSTFASAAMRCASSTTSSPMLLPSLTDAIVECHDVDPARELLLETKFFGELSSPLARERRRDSNQYGARRVVEQVLANQNSSLNRLPKADLIGQEVALRHIAEDSASRLDLMGVQFDRG